MLYHLYVVLFMANGGVDRMKVGEVYVCTICGNKVKVVEEGDGPIVCCGQDMELAS